MLYSKQIFVNKIGLLLIIIFGTLFIVISLGEYQMKLRDDIDEGLIEDFRIFHKSGFEGKVDFIMKNRYGEYFSILGDEKIYRVISDGFSNGNGIVDLITTGDYIIKSKNTNVLKIKTENKNYTILINKP